MGTIMRMEMDDTNSFKLLINNMLLEQEKRMSDSFTSKLDTQTEKITKSVHEQNSLFSGNILTLTRDVEKLEEKLKVMNVRIITVGTACSVLGGLVGFFVSAVLK